MEIGEEWEFSKLYLQMDPNGFVKRGSETCFTEKMYHNREKGEFLAFLRRLGGNNCRNFIVIATSPEKQSIISGPK